MFTLYLQTKFAGKSDCTVKTMRVEANFGNKNENENESMIVFFYLFT